MVDAEGIEPSTCRLRADDCDPECLCFQWNTEDSIAQNGALSALIWTKFWTKLPQGDDLTKYRVPSGSFYLIVDELGDRRNELSSRRPCLFDNL